MAYVLTEEGRKYLEKGLPEKRLLKMLEGPGSVTVEKASSALGKDFPVALQWCRKLKCVEIHEGLLTLAKNNLDDKLNDIEGFQNALEEIEKGTEPPNISILISRKLVEKETEGIAKRAEKFAGKSVTDLTTELIKTGMWKKVKIKGYNVESAGTHQIGKQHPYNRFLEDVRRKLAEMGFEEMTGPTIELEFWNFDALYQPQNHPSRDWTQTYSLKSPNTGTLPEKNLVERVSKTHENGWKTGSTGWGYKWDPEKAARLMPRAHGTAMSARKLTECRVPGKYFAISRCYRPDVIDATHGVEFNQTEGIVVDESLNFRSLLGILKEFAVSFGGAEKVKFFPDYYPFTEPSVQMSAKHPELGWIELGGSGIFREELTKPLGVEEPVIAWGLGIDRLAMFKLGIKDIRNLFSQDLEWLRKQVMI